jgi:hypothetical protein
LSTVHSALPITPSDPNTSIFISIEQFTPLNKSHR